MKSRTSSFNLTVFKKDLTRFAPAWGSYLILLMLVLTNIAGESEAYWRLRNVPDAIIAMGWVNLIYAAVVGQLIFGDLYNSRLCNALHAMPVTREGWFVTHTASGLAFSLLPNLAVMLIAFPLMRLEAGWPALLWWLLASELQYLFFFGVAVLCMMLSGNRLGMLALYAMINFAGLAAWWLVSVIYQPLLYGIQFNGERFYPYCPVAEISQLDVLTLDYERIENTFGEFSGYEIYGVAPSEGWGYMVGIAAIGVLALAGALVLYRKRKLECAGDFVAFKAMEPVVQVLVTLFAGGFFHIFGDVFGLRGTYVLVFCGMVFGYFACRMLLMRTNRVFQKQGFITCGIIVAVFALSLLVTKLDPLGLTTYVPEIGEIESVTFSDSYSLHRHGDFAVTVKDPADIEAILGVHGDCITREASSQPGGTDAEYSLLELRLEYKLKNGRAVNRFYDVHPLSDAGQVLKGYYTSPECVLGFPSERIPEMTRYIHSLYIDGLATDELDPDDLDMGGLLNAVVADCEAGNMAQYSGYHHPNNYDILEDARSYDYPVAHMEIGWDHEQLQAALVGESSLHGILSYRSLRVYRSCTNTLNWLEDSGLLTKEMQQEMMERYGAPKEVIITTGD